MTVSVRIRTSTTTAAQQAGSDQPSAWRPDDLGALREEQARAAFDVVNGKFRKLSGLKGTATSTHHFYPNALNPELAMDTRNLFVVPDVLLNGERVGEHIFLHMVAQPGTFSGPLRTGVEESLGWARSVLEAFD